MFLNKSILIVSVVFAGVSFGVHAVRNKHNGKTYREFIESKELFPFERPMLQGVVRKFNSEFDLAGGFKGACDRLARVIEVVRPAFDAAQALAQGINRLMLNKATIGGDGLMVLIDSGGYELGFDRFNNLVRRDVGEYVRPVFLPLLSNDIGNVWLTIIDDHGYVNIASEAQMAIIYGYLGDAWLNQELQDLILFICNNFEQARSLIEDAVVDTVKPGFKTVYRSGCTYLLDGANHKMRIDENNQIVRSKNNVDEIVIVDVEALDGISEFRGYRVYCGNKEASFLQREIIHAWCFVTS